MLFVPSLWPDHLDIVVYFPSIRFFSSFILSVLSHFVLWICTLSFVWPQKFLPICTVQCTHTYIQCILFTHIHTGDVEKKQEWRVKSKRDWERKRIWKRRVKEREHEIEHQICTFKRINKKRSTFPSHLIVQYKKYVFVQMKIWQIYSSSTLLLLSVVSTMVNKISTPIMLMICVRPFVSIAVTNS